ncbi:MAG: PAS domain S-box protein, partial [Candidatus Binatia bacterium]
MALFDIGNRLRSFQNKQIGKDNRELEGLRKSHAKYRALLDAIPDLVFLMSRDGTILDFIPAKDPDTSEPPSEIIGKSVYGVFPAGVARQIVSCGERALQTGNKQTFDLQLLRKGAMRDYKARLVVSGDDEVMTVMHEATERRPIEEECARLRLAIEQARECVMITKRDGVITYVNPAFERVTGYSSKEALGQTPRLLKSGKHERSFYQRYWQTILSGRVWQGEIVNRRKDGSLYVETQSLTPVRDERGEITHFISIGQDITERKRTEEELHRQMQRLAVLREINQAITSSLDLHAVLDILLEKIDLLLPYSALMVWLLKSESGALDLVACRNLNEEEAKGRKLLLKPPLPYTVMEYKAPVVVSNLQTDPR